jgi:hypothetical protein
MENNIEKEKSLEPTLLNKFTNLFKKEEDDKELLEKEKEEEKQKHNEKIFKEIFFNISEQEDHKSKRVLPFILLFILFIFFGIIVHIIKPVSTFLSIFLLTRFVKTKENELDLNPSKAISKGVKTIGYLIIFLLPLVHILTKGHMIVLIQKNFIGKLYVSVLLLIELFFQFPLTFLYENNLHSIFLWEQKGIEQLISPWIIFFPTDFLIDWFEIIRQLVDSLYFLSSTGALYNKIKDNKYQSFTLKFMEVSLVFYIIRILFAIAMIIYRILKKKSSERLNKLINEYKIKEI